MLLLFQAKRIPEENPDDIDVSDEDEAIEMEDVENEEVTMGTEFSF